MFKSQEIYMDKFYSDDEIEMIDSKLKKLFKDKEKFTVTCFNLENRNDNLKTCECQFIDEPSEGNYRMSVKIIKEL